MCDALLTMLVAYKIVEAQLRKSLIALVKTECKQITTENPLKAIYKDYKTENHMDAKLLHRTCKKNAIAFNASL